MIKYYRTPDKHVYHFRGKSSNRVVDLKGPEVSKCKLSIINGPWSVCSFQISRWDTNRGRFYFRSFQRKGFWRFEDSFLNIVLISTDELAILSVNLLHSGGSRPNQVGSLEKLIISCDYYSFPESKGSLNAQEGVLSGEKTITEILLEVSLVFIDSLFTVQRILWILILFFSTICRTLICISWLNPFSVTFTGDSRKWIYSFIQRDQRTENPSPSSLKDRYIQSSYRKWSRNTRSRQQQYAMNQFTNFEKQIFMTSRANP